jgi:hypothetical protein
MGTLMDLLKRIYVQVYPMEKPHPFKIKATLPTLNLPRVRLLGLILLFLGLSFPLVGCVTFNDPEASQEYSSDTIGILDGHTIIGQSLISRRPDLNGITIWLTQSSIKETAPANTEQNSINLKLFHSPADVSPVFEISILTPISGNNIPLTIKIPNQNNPANEMYFVQLSTYSDSIQINGRDEDAYPHGQVYINGQPINADLAFRLSYEYNLDALVQDLKRGVLDIWLIFPLFIMLYLPGWLFLEYSGLRRRFDFGEQAALSIGISIGTIPVVMLWTTILNFKWTAESVLFVAGFLVALLFVRLIYLYITLRKIPDKANSDLIEQQPPPENRSKPLPVIPLTLILIFLGSLSVRMIMVRDLATPAWVDSVHHALITRMILSKGSYPTSYSPYMNINPTDYHPGFHSIAAVFTWLTNFSIDKSILILGQVLNSLAIFSVYLLTKTLTQSSVAGLFAAIITGFLTPMPAYYTSWGRYTELTGLLILPVAFAFIKLLMDGETSKQIFWIIFLGAITSAGLFLVHYRVIVFLGCLILSYLLIFVLIKNRRPASRKTRVLLVTSIMVFIAILLVFPWFSQTIKSTVLPLIRIVGTNSVEFFQDFSWSYITAALGKYTLVLAGLGLIWGMIEKKRFAYMLLVWIVLLFLIANFDALRLPGGGLINNASVEIMLFIPISILGGYYLDQLFIQWKYLIPIKLITPLKGTIIFLTILLAYSGSKQLITIINPITILSRNSDLPAIDWISENIPENETIVINPFMWGYGLYAGTDGGYWISPLSGRPTLPPPVLYGLGPGSKIVKEQCQKVLDFNSNPSALWEFLTTNQLHYVYIGAKGGVLSPELLTKSELFTIIYHKDGVWLFSTKP